MVAALQSELGLCLHADSMNFTSLAELLIRFLAKLAADSRQIVVRYADNGKDVVFETLPKSAMQTASERNNLVLLNALNLDMWHETNAVQTVRRVSIQHLIYWLSALIRQTSAG